MPLWKRVLDELTGSRERRRDAAALAHLKESLASNPDVTLCGSELRIETEDGTVGSFRVSVSYYVPPVASVVDGGSE